MALTGPSYRDDFYGKKSADMPAYTANGYARSDSISSREIVTSISILANSNNAARRSWRRRGQVYECAASLCLLNSCRLGGESGGDHFANRIDYKVGLIQMNPMRASRSNHLPDTVAYALQMFLCKRR